MSKPSNYDGRGYDPPYPTLADDNAMLVEDNKTLRIKLAAAEALLQRCKLAVLDADSELSAYGHGRPLDKPEALRISDACRSAYKEIVAWILGNKEIWNDSSRQD